MVRVQAGLLVNHILIVQHRHPVTLQTCLKPFCQARLVINSGEPTSASLPVRHSILSEFCRWCQNPGLVAKQLRFSRQVSTPCNSTCKIQDGHSCLDKCLLEKWRKVIKRPWSGQITEAESRESSISSVETYENSNFSNFVGNEAFSSCTAVTVACLHIH